MNDTTHAAREAATIEAACAAHYQVGVDLDFCDGSFADLPEDRKEAARAGMRAAAAVLAGAVPESLRALSEAATQGEWSRGEEVNGDLKINAAGGPGRGFPEQNVKWSGLARFITEVDGSHHPVGEANADLACAAVNYVRTLLSAHPVGQSTGQGAADHQHPGWKTYQQHGVLRTPDSPFTGQVGVETSAREIIPFKANYRHKKTGGLYQTLDVVTNGTNGETNGQKMVLYTNGMKSFVREYSEFFDGRFERIQPRATLAARPATPEAQGPWQDISTRPNPDTTYADLPGDAEEGVGFATDEDTGEVLYLVWWKYMGRGASETTHWMPLPAPPSSGQGGR